MAFGEPMFVTKIDPITNTVTLGREEELHASTMFVRNVNMQKVAQMEDGLENINQDSIQG